jgi:ribosomal protein S27AE
MMEPARKGVEPARTLEFFCPACGRYLLAITEADYEPTSRRWIRAHCGRCKGWVLLDAANGQERQQRGIEVVH